MLQSSFIVQSADTSCYFDVNHQSSSNTGRALLFSCAVLSAEQKYVFCLMTHPFFFIIIDGKVDAKQSQISHNNTHKILSKWLKQRNQFDLSLGTCLEEKVGGYQPRPLAVSHLRIYSSACNAGNDRESLSPHASIKADQGGEPDSQLV